jgi:hypothetical protein
MIGGSSVGMVLILIRTFGGVLANRCVDGYVA